MNVDVTPGNPLNVTATNNNFGTVTVELGGTINIFTTANVQITQLTIKAS